MASPAHADDVELDAEDLKALEEVSKKGYYHARPKSEAAPPPQRLDVSAASELLAAGTAKRTDFDDFQRKWDRFDGEEPEIVEGDSGGGVSTSRQPSRVPPAVAPPQPPAPDEAVVSQLMAMGFGLEASRTAAVAANNRADAAVEYILGGGGGGRQAAPAATPGGPAAAAAAPRARAEADSQKLALLVEMGIPERRAREALEVCGNDVDRAVERAFSAADESVERVRRAREELAKLEVDVAALESGAPDAKRLRWLAEAVMQASCGLDTLDVDGDVDLRADRRVQLDRCTSLDERLTRFRGATVMDAADAETAVDAASAIAGATASATVSATSSAAAGATASVAESAAQERIAEAERWRLAGNEAFKAEDYQVAVNNYLGALELDRENVAILSNLAAAELKLEKFEAAIAHAEAANELSGGFSAKALFRRGQALEGLGRTEDACQSYRAALEVEPNDRTVRERLQECRKGAASSVAASVIATAPEAPVLAAVVESGSSTAAVDAAA